MENQFKAIGANSQPLLIVLIGLLIFSASQLVWSYRDRQNLLAVQTGQNTAYQQSVRLRGQLTGLAGQLALLAQSGDAQAQAIVDNFGKQGIKFSPPTNTVADK